MKHVLTAMAILFVSMQSHAQLTVTAQRSTQLLSRPAMTADVIQTVKKGQQVTLIDYRPDRYYAVALSPDTAFVYYPYFDGIAGIDKFKNERLAIHKAREDSLKAIQQDQAAKAKLENAVKKVAELAARFGDEHAYKIYKKQIWIGMTSEMAIASIGHPDKINRTKGATYIMEQWIYENRYLYFDNGVLTSIQDSN